jgi:glutamate/tyrosine decarboxylase-like PLP-dependent enzyme
MNKKEFWDIFINKLEGYIEESQKGDVPVVNYIPGKHFEEEVELAIKDEGISYRELLDEVDKYLKYSVRTMHPHFNNQLNAGYNFPALVGEITSYVTNTSMATYEIAPMATMIERKLVEKLNSIIGFRNGEGIMVTGGSNANMLAIHCARSRKFPDTKELGNQGHHFAVFVSNNAHYSFKKAVNVLGIGSSNLIAVETDHNGKMIPASLEEKIIEAKKEQKIPLIVASTAGTTVLGSFDPIDEIDKVAKKYDIWHHVDGAWGAPALLTPELKKLMKGVESVDSFTWDAHKLMGTGLITSFFLTSRKNTLFQSNSGGGKKYLFHEYENADYDTGHMSLQCGRKVDALKLWFAWLHIGNDGFAKFLNDQLDKARYFANKIKEHPRFKLITEPEYLNVCFQVIPNEDVDINKFNLDLRFRVVKSGKFLVNFSSFADGTIFFRHIFANNHTTQKDLDFYLEQLLEFADN